MRAIWIAMAVFVAAVILVGNVAGYVDGLPDQTARDFPAGACVNFHSGVVGADWTMERADCAGPHTHVVTAWIHKTYTSCPGPATEGAITEKGTLCLRADPEPTITPGP
jgi:hypothetical protein